MSARTRTIVDDGMHGMTVDVECQLSKGLPSMVLVGSASSSINEAKERVRSALINSQLSFPRKRIVVNLAPGDIPKSGTSLDLAIAMSILVASEQVAPGAVVGHVFVGELGLDGSVRPVRGIIGKLQSDGTNDHCFVIPKGNLKQAQIVPGIRLIGISSLKELYLHFSKVSPLKEVNSHNKNIMNVATHTDTLLDMDDVVGQIQAKRALEIAAAGGHNVLLSGPPGTGKSMLAKVFQSILPPMSQKEVLEVTHLHSLANRDYEEVIYSRPFRSPHHSASLPSIIGGGQYIRPGEISLSHCGALFLDELPEFNQQVIEALRQPLEDRQITITRAKGSVLFPASFTLIATCNPCPCGYLGSSRECECLPNQILRYKRKLSGPILDRIDLFSTVDQVDHANLLGSNHFSDNSHIVAQRVFAARTTQAKRFGDGSLNSSMTNRTLKTFVQISSEAQELLNIAARKLNISARSYMKTLKVARTIADLAESVSVEVPHLSEALQFRLREIQNQQDGL